MTGELKDNSSWINSDPVEIPHLILSVKKKFLDKGVN